MIAMIKRILNLAGKHKSKILLGILFNFLKSVYGNGFMGGLYCCL